MSNNTFIKKIFRREVVYFLSTTIFALILTIAFQPLSDALAYKIGCPNLFSMALIFGVIYINGSAILSVAILGKSVWLKKFVFVNNYEIWCALIMIVLGHGLFAFFWLDFALCFRDASDLLFKKQ